MLANGIYSFNIYGFRIFYLALGLAMPYLYRNFSLTQGLVIISAIAVGGGLTDISLAMSGGIILIFLTSYLFNANKWIAGLCATLTPYNLRTVFPYFPGSILSAF